MTVEYKKKRKLNQPSPTKLASSPARAHPVHLSQNPIARAENISPAAAGRPARRTHNNTIRNRSPMHLCEISAGSFVAHAPAHARGSSPSCTYVGYLSAASRASTMTGPFSLRERDTAGYKYSREPRRG